MEKYRKLKRRTATINVRSTPELDAMIALHPDLNVSAAARNGIRDAVKRLERQKERGNGAH